MIQLPPLPDRIARLPKDDRGYPVPRFVQWLKDGKRAEREEPGAAPDFRYANASFRWRAFHNGHCWVCGERLGVHRVYVLGPMCVINRVTPEPASHRECAEFSARACPFLTRPRMRRIPLAEDEPRHVPGGTMIERNPGCVALYETPLAKAFNDGKGGWLIKLDAPSRIDWWAEGRVATRDQVLASISSGYPLLYAEALKDGPAAIAELEGMAKAAMKYLPAEEAA